MSQTQALVETLTLQGIDLWVENEQLRYRGPKSILTTERLAQLQQHKTVLLGYLATTTYAATWEQKNAWVAYQNTAQKNKLHVSFVAQLQGVLDEVAFQRAWQTLLQRHTTLRTTYRETLNGALTALGNGNGNGNSRNRVPSHSKQAPALIATIHSPQALSVSKLDAKHWRAEELQAQLAAHQAHRFDLTQGPLLRVTLFLRAEQEQVLLITAPHITLDEPSLWRLLDEFGQLYAAAQSGKPVTLPSLEMTPLRYAAWQADQPVAEVHAGDAQTMAVDEELILNLPIDFRHPLQAGTCRAQQHIQIDPTLVCKLQELATQQFIRLDTLLVSAFQILLQRYTGQNKLLIGLSLSARSCTDFRDLVGGFTADVVLRTEVSTEVSEVSCSTLCSQTQQQLNAFRTQTAGLSTNRQQVAFALHHHARRWQPDETRSWGQLAVTPLPLSLTVEDKGDKPDTTELKLDLVEYDGAISGLFTYRPDLFAAETITRMVGHYTTLLKGMVADPKQSIALLPLLTEAERQQILVDWNRTDTDFPRDKCLHQLFEEQVKRTPDAVAVIFDARGEQQDASSKLQPTTLTYAELNARANQLAHYLHSLGVGAETRVAICIERSIEMVVGLLGILKAGGTYIPLDPTYPHDRLTFMLQDSAAPLLLTQAHLLTSLSTIAARTLCIDQDWAKIAALPSTPTLCEVKTEQLAYIIYTSGSTGHPKGVQIAHSALTNFLCSMQTRPGFTHDDRLLSVTTLSFDIAGLELYLPLISGGTVVLVDQATTRNGIELAAAIVDNGITVMQATPATWQLLLTAGWQGTRNLTLLCGGEALSPTLADQLQRCSGELWNLYGPTETTIWSTFSQVLANDSFISIGGGPLGTVANTQLYLLNAALQPVPIGVSGELHIGGEGVARGYLNRPELTAEKFIANPFIAPDKAEQIYKTGDLARWRFDSDGLPKLEYMGRIDHQVKIRGFRIEQGEIEAVLRQHPAVQEAVVSAHENNGDKQLVAYITPNASRAYPVRQLLRFAREGRSAGLHYSELTDRINVFYHNRSELDFLYREILDEVSYLHHGITLPAGSCVFDVGANIGMFSLLVHQQCKDATIYSFEPLSPIFKLLELNIALYGVNAQTFNYGLASSSGSASFTYYPQVSVASTRFGDATEEHEMIKSYLKNQTSEELSSAALDDLLALRLQSEQITCQFKTLSEVIAEQGITQIDLLKVDVEKSEYDVLMGIAENDWPKIKQVVLEVHDTQLAAIQQLLEEHGFRCVLEQDAMLKATGLHNLYAIHQTMQNSGQNSGQNPGPSKDDNGVKTNVFSNLAHLIQDVQAHLRQKLPDYMLPAACILLEEMPLTPNGKVNRQALPKPQAVNEARLPEIVQPDSPAEVTIANIWREVLNRTQVSIDDKFMEVGGHSLQAMQVVAKINSAFTGNFSITDFFKYPTIRDLANYLTQNNTDTAHSELGLGQERGATRRAARQQAQQRRTATKG